MKSPLISIYVPTKNRTSSLLTAIRSVLRQTYKNIEIVISDDGSTDSTKEAVKSIAKSNTNITYIRSAISKGANHARNQALRAAKGEFITGLDDDDIFLSHRIEFLLDNWNERFSFISTNFINSYNDGQKNSHYPNINESISRKDILFNNLASNQVFTKLAFLNNVGGFNESIQRLQDWDCWIRLMFKYGSSYRYKECTYIMNHDQSNRVSNNVEYDAAYKKLIYSNLYIYENLLGKEFVKKYLLDIEKPSLFDLLKLQSKHQYKKIIRRHLEKIYS